MDKMDGQIAKKSQHAKNKTEKKRIGSRQYNSDLTSTNGLKICTHPRS